MGFLISQLMGSEFLSALLERSQPGVSLSILPVAAPSLRQPLVFAEPGRVTVVRNSAMIHQCVDSFAEINRAFDEFVDLLFAR